MSKTNGSTGRILSCKQKRKIIKEKRKNNRDKSIIDSFEARKSENDRGEIKVGRARFRPKLNPKFKR